MPQDPTERPATIDEVISAVAKANGVAPALALAVANRESKLDPNAVGDGGKAIGLFQLHPAAAQDTATADRSDPFQNITGGVKYLKQLSDKYQGDVSKVLQAYNGGMEGVDAGTVSPAAQAYAADILASLSAGARPNKAAPAVQAPLKPVASHAPTSNYQDQKSSQYGINLHTTEPEKKPDTILQQLGKPFDPRTTEGRVNLISGAAAGAFTMATDGVGLPEAPAVGAAVARGVLPWIARVIGPPVVAGLAGAGTMAAEKKLGTAPKDADSVAKTGATQALYETGGQLAMWGVRRVARPLLATSVGRASKQYLEELATSVKRSGEQMMASARQQATALLESTSLGREDAMSQAKLVSARLTGAVKQHAADHLAQTELDNAALIKQAEQAMQSSAPSIRGAADAVKDVVRGQPGVLGEAGPATRALQIAGARVEQAAQDGPALATEPLKAALNEMGEKARPSALFEAPAPTRGIGFLANIGSGRVPMAASTAAAGGATSNEAARFAKIIADQLGLPETHPLPGILGQIQAAPDQIAFADAHKLKRLLDEAVNWDQLSKKHLTQITKGIRSTLREQMSVHEPYNAATKAYGDIVPLYRKGVGLAAIKAAATDPDKIARLLDEKAPQQAAALRQLLVDQSAAGGNEAMGAKAWQAVRETYAFNNLESQGVEGLSGRVQQLVTTHPEFVREVFGDLAGQQYLSNLDRIGRAYEAAIEQAAANTQTSVAAGRTAVANAKEIGRVGVQEASQVGKAAQRQSRQTADAIIDRAKQATRVSREGVADLKARLRASSINPDALQSDEANAIRATLGRGAFKALGVLRLLSSPKASDIIEWAARSNANTLKLAQVLLTPVDDRVVSSLLRDALGMAPVASHDQTAPTPTR